MLQPRHLQQDLNDVTMLRVTVRYYLPVARLYQVLYRKDLIHSLTNGHFRSVEFRI